jgi:hypothetical protein
VAENCLRATGEHRREPSSLDGQIRMTDGIDRSMHTMNTPGSHPRLDGAVRQPYRNQLRPSDHPMLPRSNSSNRSIG